MARKAKQLETSRWHDARLAALLVAATMIAYLPAMSAGFIWDDPDYIVNNANLRSLSGLWHTWTQPRSLPQYYPLVHTSFWIEYQIWNLRPAGYHIVNILLHAAAALLLWRVLKSLELPGAWVAAAIFALHPVHVESVAWITERKNVLSGVFYFAALLAYLRQVSGFGVQGSAANDLSPSVLNREPRPLNPLYVLSFILFLCALLSKTVTCSLPAATLLIIYWKRGRISMRQDVRPLIPFFVAGLIAAGATAHLERDHVGAQGWEWELSFIQRCLVAARALWFYAYKLVLPIELAFIYPRWRIDSSEAWQWVFPIALVGVVVWLWLSRGRLGRGPLVALLFYAGTLLPALGFVNIYPMRYSFVADHFQYLASTGLIALAVAAAAQLMARLRRSRAGAFAAAVVLITLGVLTFLRSQVYHDVLTLWSDTVDKNPDSWMVRTNLGHALVENQRFEEAFDQYQLARELAPKLPETHWNVAVGLARRGEFEEALKALEQAIRLEPGFAQAFHTRGTIYLKHGRVDDAMQQFITAIELQPGLWAAHYQLGKIFEQRGQLYDAEEHYRTAASSAMDDADVHYNLATVLLKRQKFEQAAVHYSQAIRIRPDWAEAHANLGAALHQLGRMSDAINAYQRALQLDPNLVAARRNLEQALRSR